MNRLTAAGRRGRGSAALLAALALLITGCGEAGGLVIDPPAAIVLEDAPHAEPPLDESTLDETQKNRDAADADIDDAAVSVTESDPDPKDNSEPDAAVGTALEMLAALPVKGRAPKTGYDRKAKFGSPWLDVDRNGCDTRNDMLQRDLTNLTMSGPCKVLSGTLADKYTGTTIEFVRGNKTSTLVQIDHVVALSDAWQKGAQQLSQPARIAFANDPINLYAADGPANSAKSDSDAASWLPKNRAFRCEYVARQVSVKAAYKLWVTAAEHDAIERILTTCPDEPAVESELAAKAIATADPDPAPAADPSPEPAQTPEPSQPPAPVEPRPAVPAPDTYFKNCTAARDAGAAPVRVGQPGYGRHLDRDGDGVGCE